MRLYQYQKGEKLFGVSVYPHLPHQATVGIQDGATGMLAVIALPNDEIRKLRDALTAHLGEGDEPVKLSVEDRLHNLEAAVRYIDDYINRPESP